MRVQVVNIDAETRKWCKIYLWSIFTVKEVKIVTYQPRTTPHCQKQYIVHNGKSSTGITMLRWYEVKVLNP